MLPKWISDPYIFNVKFILYLDVKVIWYFPFFCTRFFSFWLLLELNVCFCFVFLFCILPFMINQSINKISQYTCQIIPPQTTLKDYFN